MKSGLWEATTNLSKHKNCFAKVIGYAGVYVDIGQYAEYNLDSKTCWKVEIVRNHFKNYSYIAPLSLLNWDS